MAEGENTADLKTLIAQRNQRPSYTRMISWEFYREQTEPSKQQRRRRRSKKQSEDLTQGGQSADEDCDDDTISSALSLKDIDDSDDDITLDDTEGQFLLTSESDSEYFSAEDQSHLETPPQDSGDRSNDRSDDTVALDENIDGAETKSETNVHERYRAPSKKQKRKKRKACYVMHSDSFLPYINTDVMPDILVEQISEGNNQTIVTKTVPTLVELCIASARRTHRKLCFPHGFKPTVRESNYVESFRQFQISWLQSILGYLSKKEDIDNNLSEFNSDKDGTEHTVILETYRNIWNREFFTRNRDSWNNVGEYEGSQQSSILRNTNANFIACSSYTSNKSIRTLRVLGAMATLIDLMMPCTVSEKIGKRNAMESESEKLSKSMDTIMIRVKGALKLRFEALVDSLFHKVIPYVFWARGDILQATHLFTKVVEIEEDDNLKPMYCGEIGRMYAQYEDPETACKYIRAATDLALERVKARYTNEINGQMMMLLANVYDQGMMTHHKRTKATDMWQYIATASYLSNTGALLMAVNSLLCFHSGPSTNDAVSSFEYAKDRLEKMTEPCPHVLYFLSMLRALQGEEAESEKLYKEFMLKVNKESLDVPGPRLGPVCPKGKKMNIWGHLCEQVRNHGSPEPLQVLWRVQLQNLCVSSTGTLCDADVCSRELNLRLNADGFITGDMQTVLPPRRGISLNPYTGAITNVYIPCKTEVWKTATIWPDQYNDSYDFGFIPTPLEIYTDEDGVSVHMMAPDCNPLFPNSIPGVASLFWSNDKGERLKINLMKIVYDTLYQSVKRKVLKLSITNKENTRWEKQMLKLLDKLYNQKRQLDMQYIKDEMGRWQEKAKKEKDGKPITTEERKEYPFTAYNVPPRFRDLIISPTCVVYDKTLVIQCEMSYEYFLLYFDCTTKEIFAKPKLVWSLLDDCHNESVYTQKRLCPNKVQQYRIPYAKVFYTKTINKKPENFLKVCGQGGKFLYSHPVDTKVEGEFEDMKPYIVGDSLVRINITRKLWCLRDNEVKVCDDMEDIQDMRPITGQVILVKLEKHICFVHIPSLTILKVTDRCREKLVVCEDNKLSTLGEVEVLTTKLEADRPSVKVIIALDNMVVTLRVPTEQDEKTEIEMLEAVKFSGFPTEACILGELGGYLVAWTQHYPGDKDYQEHVSYFNSSWKLLGVLPCLGARPRSFFPILLPEDPVIKASHPGYGDSGWHVYMRDGYEGILGVKLKSFP